MSAEQDAAGRSIATFPGCRVKELDLTCSCTSVVFHTSSRNRLRESKRQGPGSGSDGRPGGDIDYGESILGFGIDETSYFASFPWAWLGNLSFSLCCACRLRLSPIPNIFSV
uniref:Uncharacterized protein n=1 Tax=Utricularia reniformis TaxID=192314 RepID=A0A1Y0AYZ9_9LAMI|nr:hypothetical protein AEK19_MT1595 [Utricularia reniformis]ART30392.1 hypothetical protein AEK19_MT1595 [Utricularia reniformis]